MDDSINWFLMAGVVVIFELFTGTFYLLMIALGMAVGGGLALLGMSINWQLTVAATVGVLATLLLRRSRFGGAHKGDSARDPNVNMDIGQTVAVDTWNDGQARVLYRGAQWDVMLAPDCAPEPGTFTIREVQGSRLIVSN